MGSICLLSDGGLPSVSCVTHYSFVRRRVLLASWSAPHQLQAAPKTQMGTRFHERALTELRGKESEAGGEAAAAKWAAKEKARALARAPRTRP